MRINPDVADIFDFKYDDFQLIDYVAEPNIKAPIAV
jgi:thymidylate synthase